LSLVRVSVKGSNWSNNAASGGDAAVAPDAPKPYVIVNGIQYTVSRDNLETLENDMGNTKVDVNGNLVGSREFKTNTFTVPTRNNDVKYMLAIDCARACGYRDSLYYFRRNPMMLKLNLTQAEKEYLIDLGKLHTNLRHRSVTMVTARSAFKQHGAKIVRSASDSLSLH
jgi:chromatin structure-remodeling complex protein RSC7